MYALRNPPFLGTDQVVQFRVLAEERLVVLLLLVHKIFDVHVEAGRGDALGALRGLLTLLKQQSQQREQGVPARREERGHQRYAPHHH